jgi:hypothetical protein
VEIALRKCLKILTVSAVLASLGAAAQAKTTHYKCTMTSISNSYFVAKSYDLVLDGDAWTALVKDDVSSQASGRAVLAKIETQNAKRTTVVWRAMDFQPDPRELSRTTAVVNSLTFYPDGRAKITVANNSALMTRPRSYAGAGSCTKVDG